MILNNEKLPEEFNLNKECFNRRILKRNFKDKRNYFPFSQVAACLREKCKPSMSSCVPELYFLRLVVV